MVLILRRVGAGASARSPPSTAGAARRWRSAAGTLRFCASEPWRSSVPMLYIWPWQAPALPPDAVDLFHDHRRLGEAEPGAAVLLRDQRRQPAGLGQRVDERLGIAALARRPCGSTRRGTRRRARARRRGCRRGVRWGRCGIGHGAQPSACIVAAKRAAIASACGCTPSRITQRPATITSRQGRVGAARRPARRAGDRRRRRAAPASLGIDHQRVGARADDQPPARLAGRGGAARDVRGRTGARRSTRRRPSGAAATLRSAQRQALAVLEPAQLLAPVARRRGCRSRSTAARRRRASRAGRTGRRRGWPRCSGRARRRRRCARPRRSRRRRRASRARAASARRAGRSRASHSIGRAPVAARQSSTSPVCSATWMWIGPAKPSAERGAARRSTPAPRRAASGSRGRRRRSGRRAPRDASRRLRSTSAGRAAKRRWSSRSAVGGEAGALVEHRQHRQADAGVGGRIGQRPRHRERVGVGRCRQVACCR